MVKDAKVNALTNGSSVTSLTANETKANADSTTQENKVVELKREVGLSGGISFIVGGIIGMCYSKSILLIYSRLQA